MKFLEHLLGGLWMIVGNFLLIVGLVTGLSWVFGVLGVVLMFGAVLVPFWLVYPLLVWWSKRKCGPDQH
ncbi:MAG: hypothetical protein ACE5Q6_11140 [Dehalococcoidia bacterium]